MDTSEAKATLIDQIQVPQCQHEKTRAVSEPDGTLVRCADCGAGKGEDGVWRGPLGSADAAADELIVRVGRFFGECAGGDTFCGLSIDETRSADGLLTSLKLVPCDLVNGEPVRREGKFRNPQLAIARAVQ